MTCLVAYGLGTLQADESAVVEIHLADCEACCETLLDLKDDTFVELVRRANTPARDLRTPENKGADRATGSANDVEAPSGLELPVELAEHPRYRVLELLGRGGMGDVYMAQHQLMNRLVALKIINQKLTCNPQAVQRFRREVRAAARLTHPNVVAAYDAEQAGDIHFLAMEYVRGIELSDQVKQQGPLPVRETSLTDVLTRKSDWQAQPLRGEQLFQLSGKIFANEMAVWPFLIDRGHRRAREESSNKFRG